jgi:hypothetical protein
LPKNSVKSSTIKNGQVKSADLASNAVTSSKVKDSSLLVKDFEAGQLPAGTKGDTGPKGDIGPKGDKGDKGDPGATNVVVRSTTISVPNNATQTATVTCAAGETVIGGGGGMSGTGLSDYVNLYTESNVRMSGPTSDDSTGIPADGTKPTGWRLVLTNTAGATRDMHAFALCARP